MRCSSTGLGRSSAVLAAAAVLSCAAPARAQRADPAPQPPAPLLDAPRPERTRLTALWVTGLSLFGTAYLAGIPTTYVVSRDLGSKFARMHAAVMAIPFAGPWMEAAGFVERESMRGAPLLAVMGLTQILGAGLTAVGIAVTRERPSAAPLSGWTFVPRPFGSVGPTGKVDRFGLAIGGPL